MASTKTKLTTLRTVYPPISNADAAGLQRIPDVEEILRTSDFYMIVGRAQARLVGPEVDPRANVLSFGFVIGGGDPTPVRIHIEELPGVAAMVGTEIHIQVDQAGSGFKVWDGPADAAGSEIVEWFTTEKLLWDAARGRPGIYGLENSRELATYDLLYVGIARAGDSFDRLLKRGHVARMNILASEPQRHPGARPSDETFLIMFRADPLIFQTFDPDHDFDREDFSGNYDGKRIVADAEKAFVNLLRPPYNKELFAKYPRGTDGLHGAGYLRYGYVIGEQMAFNTAHGTVRGGLGPAGLPTDDADAIFVHGDAVTFFQPARVEG
ncbi:hypothetical protein [Methylobacterium oryzae]